MCCAAANSIPVVTGAHGKRRNTRVLQVKFGVITLAIIRKIGCSDIVGLVEALCYRPEGCGLDYRWVRWNFSST
jgi:hypothetical protein